MNKDETRQEQETYHMQINRIYNKHRSQIERLQSKLDESLSDIERLNVLNKELREKLLKGQRSEYELKYKLEQEKTKQQKECKVYEWAISEKETLLISKEEEISELKHSLLSKAHEINEQNDTIRNLELRLDELVVKHATYTQENPENLKQVIVDMTKDMESIQDRVVPLQNTCQKLKDELSKVTEERDKLLNISQEMSIKLREVGLTCDFEFDSKFRTHSDEDSPTKEIDEEVKVKTFNKCLVNRPAVPKSNSLRQTDSQKLIAERLRAKSRQEKKPLVRNYNIK